MNPGFENKTGHEVYVTPILSKDKRYFIGNVKKIAYVKIGELAVKNYNKVDAGLVYVGPNNEETREKVLPGITSVNPIMITGIKRNIRVGEKVRKLGVMTGETRGVVETVGSTIVTKVNNKNVYFSEQITTSIKASSGDSGSLGYTEDFQAFGLLFGAGDSRASFNVMDEVLKSLNCNLLI